MSTSMPPTLVTQSTSSRASPFPSPSGAMSERAPVDVSAWTTAMTRGDGCAASNCSGSIGCPQGASTVVTSAPQRAASTASGYGLQGPGPIRTRSVSGMRLLTLVPWPWTFARQAESDLALARTQEEGASVDAATTRTQPAANLAGVTGANVRGHGTSDADRG